MVDTTVSLIKGRLLQVAYFRDSGIKVINWQKIYYYGYYSLEFLAMFCERNTRSAEHFSTAHDEHFVWKSFALW